MGIIGGTVGYRCLQAICRSGEPPYLNASAYRGHSKLEALFGPVIWRHLTDKIVVDFGCGVGAETVEIASRGARRAIGLDIQDRFLEAGRRLAERAGVADRCEFATRIHERADVIVTLDSFEHFDDPAAVLEQMNGILRPGGCVLASFGPTWFHPLGGHLFSVFPWAHLVFTEKALIRWRSDFKTDGATRFREVEGGLNQMTIRRFERIVAASPFRFAEFEARPIRKLRRVANRLTREVTTAVVRCRLIKA